MCNFLHNTTKIYEQIITHFIIIGIGIVIRYYSLAGHIGNKNNNI